MTTRHSLLLKSIAGITGTVMLLAGQFASAQQCPAIAIPENHPAARR